MVCAWTDETEKTTLDDIPEDGGASEDDCRDQGGQWVDPDVVFTFGSMVESTPLNDPSGAADWLQMGGDFSNGAADILTFGITVQINNALGNSQFVNNCSGSHTLGTVVGIALSTAIGGAAGAEAAEANAGREGFEFSHWIPDRMGGPRSILNGNWVSIAEHAVNDPFRYKFMPAAFKALNAMNPAALQQWNRIPLLLKGIAVGAAFADASASRGSGCR